MRTNLSVADLGDLLDQPLMATLATYRRSGEVLLSAVWFEWRDGGFELVIGRNDFKAQHIWRDPGASIAVYESALPLRGLELAGTARLSTDGLHELRMGNWQRYMSAPPPTPDETEIRVRIEGVVRAWELRRPAHRLTERRSRRHVPGVGWLFCTPAELSRCSALEDARSRSYSAIAFRAYWRE